MPGGIKKYVCSTCSKTYAKAEHLIRHERTHTGDKPFACTWCHRKFSRQDSLARHQQRQHHDDPPPQLLAEHTDFNETTIAAGVIVLDAGSGPDIRALVGEQSPHTLLDDAGIGGVQTQPLDNSLQNVSTDDFFLPLTWPDSEELLQTILTSNLAPWSENVELLPTQHLLNETPPAPRDNDSPWLTQDTNHQPESGSHAIRNVSQIISDLSANVTYEAESASLNTIFLDACLHMFFDQFASNFPVCHRPTFVFRDWTHPLLLNAIALGSLFVGHEVNIAKGEVLWKLAHTAVATSWHSLILHRGPNDPCRGIQLILTALLGQTYAMLSGTARLRSTAQIFHSLGFYWARQCDMFNFKRKFSAIAALNAESAEQKMESWKLWAAEEVELRALLGHYVLDGQLPYFTGAPTCQRHASNPLPLPCSDSLFRATTIEEWIAQLRQEQTQTTTFRQLLVSLFAGEPNTFGSTLKLSSFTIRILIEGLESFITEANSVEGSVVGNPSNSAISNALGSIYAYIVKSTDLSDGDKLELLIRWHVVAIDADVNFNNLCRNICSQYATDQVVFGQSKLDAPMVDLRKWAESPHARKALLHAAAVWDSLALLPVKQTQAIHIPISTFMAATIYCAFVLAGTTIVTLPYPVNWPKLMSVDLDNDGIVEDCDYAQTLYLLHPSRSYNGTRTKNLLYDSNTFLMHLRQIRRPWTLCASFENILQQWLSRCGI